MEDHDVLVYELPDWEPELRALLSTELQAAGRFLLAADRVSGVPVPFGIDEGVWGEVRQRASSLSTALEEDADDDLVAAEARLLRAILARFV